MGHLETIAAVRQLVAEMISDNQWGQDGDTVETILIKAGCYCGRSYRYEQGRACWLADVQQLQFYDLDDQLLQTIDLDESSLEAPSDTPGQDDQQAA